MNNIGVKVPRANDIEEAFVTNNFLVSSIFFIYIVITCYIPSLIVIIQLLLFINRS